jgi:hypothetical protein
MRGASGCAQRANAAHSAASFSWAGRRNETVASSTLFGPGRAAIRGAGLPRRTGLVKARRPRTVKSGGERSRYFARGCFLKMEWMKKSEIELAHDPRQCQPE